MGQILSLVGEVGLGALLAKAVGGDWKLGGAAGLGCFVLVLLLRIPKSYRVPEKGGVVISGASSGIGRVAVATALRAAAEQLAKLGYTVFAGVRKEADGVPLKAAGCVPVIMDVAVSSTVEAAAAEIKAALAASGQHLVGIVNNAGVSGTDLPLELETDANLAFVFDVNVFGILKMNKHFLPLLRDLPGGGGRVVNIGSVMGHLQVPNAGTYCMTKHSVEALSGCLRTELAKWDIAVSVLNPGYVRTGIASKSEGQQQAVVSELRASLTPAQQELYPGLFDAEKRARLRAKALKAFENAPLPDETTTPAIVDAISSGRPQLVYTVGWLQPTKRWPSAELGLWLQWLLPSATWFWLMGSGSGKKKKKKKLS